MNISDIAFTGYPVSNMRRARGFYEKVLGLSPTVYELDNGASWVEYELASGTLAISDIDPKWQPRDNGPSIAFEVDDFDAMMSHLKANEVAILTEEIDTPVCRFSNILDTEGNAITIHCRKATHPDKTSEKTAVA